MLERRGTWVDANTAANDRPTGNGWISTPKPTATAVTLVQLAADADGKTVSKVVEREAHQKRQIGLRVGSSGA